MLILHTLAIQSMHGYAILQHIKRVTDDALSIEAGSLYPALDRLQRKGWLRSHWEQSPAGRRARYYTVTPTGRRQLGEEVAGYRRAIWAIARVLGHSEG